MSTVTVILVPQKPQILTSSQFSTVWYTNVQWTCHTYMFLSEITESNIICPE